MFMIAIALFSSLFVALASLLVFGAPTTVFYGYGIVVPIVILLPYIVHLVDRAAIPLLGTESLRYFGTYALLTIFINAPASLYFHPAGIQYDRFVHFAVAFLGFLFLCHLRFVVFGKNPSAHARKSVFLLSSFMVMFTALFVWEAYQYAVDAVFGSTLFFDVGQDIVTDVREDIVYGLAGLFAGVVYVALRFAKFSRHGAR